MADTSHRRGFLRGLEGAAGVEFAIVLPFLALIMFGTIEFGRLFHAHNVVAKGVRDAARYLARVPANACSGGAWTDKSGTAVAETKNLATRGVITGGTQNLFFFDTADVTVTQSCINNSNGLAGIYGASGTIRQAVVTATVTYTFLFGEYVIPGVPSLQFIVAHSEPQLAE